MRPRRRGARRLVADAARYGTPEEFVSTGTRLIRVLHAIFCGDADAAYVQTRLLVQRARREQLFAKLTKP